MDVRTMSRRAAAASLIVGPLALALPTTYTEADANGAGQLSLAAAHLTAAHYGNLVLIPGLLIVPAMVYAARLARPRAPRLAFLGGGLSALAWMAGLVGLGATGLVVYHAVGLPDQSTPAALIDRLGADPIVGTLTLLFVLGHVLGMVMLGAALWRSRAIPQWAAVLFTAYPLVHLLAHVVGSVPLDNASGVLLAVPSIMAAVAVLRTSNAHWDLSAGTEPTRVAMPEPVSAQP